MTRFPGAEAAAWARGEWCPDVPESVSGVTQDSRTVQPGDLYIAIPGERFDGHDFVAEALSNGAVGAMVRVGRMDRTVVRGRLLEVKNTLCSLAALANGYRRAMGARIIAVTGSAGKSTVKEMIGQVLGRSASTARTHGNWNNNIGLPLSMLRMQRYDRYGVFEMGMNRPGEIRALCSILEPDWGLITNVGPAHMGCFGTLEAIAEEKSDLLRALPAGGHVFLCRDDAQFERMRNAATCRVVTVSACADADYTADPRAPGDASVVARERKTGECRILHLPGYGDHQVVNVLFTVAVARLCGLPWDPIADGLASYQALPMRGEETDVGGVLVVNDAYNANPLSMRASIRAFAEKPAVGMKWLVLGDMLELGDSGPDEHREMGSFVAKGAWAGLITVGSLGRHIADGALVAGFPDDRVFRCADAAEAGRVLAAHVAEGDAVLVKASRGMRLENAVLALCGEKEGVLT